ncbi:uncharacterized protein [Haliotis cracherodii]|uniref:uncharacterized protein n=1 Tax=Haliotis cracherodii TaxID=6455 RepID=UPI0039ED5834
MPTTRGKAQRAADAQPQPQPQPQPVHQDQVIEACRELLMDIRIRSMIGSDIMYYQAVSYDYWAHWMLIAASGIMGVVAVGLCQYIPVGDGWITDITKITMGFITATSGTFKAGSMLLHKKFEKKQKLFNKAGAGWQELELNILHFLATTEDTDNRDKYEKFTKDCIEQQTKLKCMAIAEKSLSIYMSKSTEHFPSAIVARYKYKRDFFARTRAELEKEKSFSAESGDD